MEKCIFGVDIGGTTVKIGLFSEEGRLLDDWEIATRKDENGKHILSDIAKALLFKCKEKKISCTTVKGIGVGIPGPMKNEEIVLECVNLGWGEVNVAKELSMLTGMRVCIGNDANVAALGEMWQGGGRGYREMAMITLGTGVGAGIILQGRILAGVHGAAGEIGHLTMKKDESACCNCGKRGCLEQYASANGLVHVAKEHLLEKPGISTCLQGDFDAKDIFAAAKKGDAFALQIVDETMDILGEGMANIACVIDVEAFVLGGGMAKAGDLLLRAVQKSFKKYAFHACKDIEFKLAELGNRAGIYGGAKMIFDKV